MSDITKADTKQVWKVSYPLMISFMSTFLMLFVDRLFLAYYDKSALNAAATSGTLAWSLILTWMTLAALVEVFVAQYNGAQRFKEIAKPIWQMIWLATFSILFFASSALWITKLIYSSPEQSYQRDYFQWLMLSGPFAVLLSGISAFYVGQGKAQIVKWLSIIGNLVNVLLDPILIFGIKGVVPSLGIKGAAIATGLGYAVQAAIILFFFLRKSNRDTYNTHLCTFDFSLLKRCIKIGTPPAIFAGLEVLAWALFYSMMETVSPEHIFVCSVCQSIEILFLFFCFGLEKGVAAIAGNLIGANKQDQLKKLAKSARKLIFYFSIFIILTTIIYPDPMISLFLPDGTSPENLTIMQRLTTPEALYYKPIIKTSLIFVALYLIVENFRWLYSGILIAAGDTFYIMITGTISVWFFLLIPSYFIVVIAKQSIVFAFAIWVFYGIVASLFNYLRFISGAWKRKAVIDSEICSKPQDDSLSSLE
ncbi:MAG: MATE family efflux transporter [Simkaniaceae bacterium]|nr:MATE family efflux transporter [Simkaniaceae bacterium]